MAHPGTERLVPAKKGYTVYAGETALHSRYDPREEAEKYAASLEAEKNRPYLILIEPGLPYLERALRRSIPEREIISLHCSPFFSPDNPALEAAGLGEERPGWNPARTEGLEDFLEGILSGAEAAEIAVIEWRPALNAYGRAYADLAARTVECIRRITANRATVRNFGRRWVRNALRNLALLEGAVEARGGASPVLVCAAGPGLEDAAEGIRRWKRSPSPPFVIAVSSAVPALLYRGIEPDMVIASDGGLWALFHLIESRRIESRRVEAHHRNGGGPVLAAALTAALPSQAAELPSLILCDGSLWQELLLRSFDLPFAVFPQRGTVSASALDLALSLGGPVYLAGLDLAHRDLKTHAGPHAFDRFLEGCRFFPRYSRLFEREETIRRSGSHGVYAAWFKTHVQTLPGEIYTLGDGTPLGLPRAEFPPGEDAPPRTAMARVTRAAGQTAGGLMPRFLPRSAGREHGQKGAGREHENKTENVRRRGIALLLKALADPLTAERIGGELGELLLPGRPPRERPDPGELKKALLAL
ncbi:MAG: DUF115 domain-containing protein [Treponema sp.]|jgi:hypothetical protein|nr:DUF115 domain-containing protein [Treponema sp.]